MHKQKLQVFSVAGPSELLALDIVELKTKTTTVNQHINIVMDKVSKLTRAIPTTKMGLTQKVKIFSKN